MHIFLRCLCQEWSQEHMQAYDLCHWNQPVSRFAWMLWWQEFSWQERKTWELRFCILSWKRCLLIWRIQVDKWICTTRAAVIASRNVFPGRTAPAKWEPPGAQFDLIVMGMIMKSIHYWDCTSPVKIGIHYAGHDAPGTAILASSLGNTNR